MDKLLEIYKLFAYLICIELKNKLTYEVKYSQNKDKIEIWLHGYPLYPSKVLGDIIITLPINYISIQGEIIRYKSIGQSSVGFYQEYIGKGFAHPHVWNNGQPDWDHVPKTRIDDLFVYFFNSLLLTNITKDSLEIGHPCPDSIMVIENNKCRNMKEVYQLCKEHSEFIQDKLKLNIIDLDLPFLNQRFNNKFNYYLSLIFR